MCSMMLGSLLYKYIMTHYPHITPTRLLVVTLSIAAASFFIPVLWRDERVTMWCFCIFEICCGVYFPLMAYQKGKIVEDGVRANVYGLMRIPLNIFVVLVLSTTKEGKYHRPVKMEFSNSYRCSTQRSSIYILQRPTAGCCGC